RGLAQSRRAIEQHVVQRLATGARRFDRHAEIFFDLDLPDKFFQQARPQLQFERSIVFHRCGGDDALFYLWSWFGAHAGASLAEKALWMICDFGLTACAALLPTLPAFLLARGARPRTRRAPVSCDRCNCARPRKPRQNPEK